jgi:hypothetical protein
MATTNAPAIPEHSRAKKLLEQAENYERKTQGIGREIKRIGRDTRRQQRQLSPEGPSGMHIENELAVALLDNSVHFSTFSTFQLLVL